ncbi:response regulator [Dechloromonas denitrificans]|uniref:response regulator n=1 Tax=Dechloromonas denitrificans TaxID=281362 RepID=UPI001CFBA874|nr:response regulator transcription factor [Dechloromonas denitrificans]UCV06090.1 response regulator transcription factor [Dechloromonas denitrificans]
MAIRILLADDHKILREALKGILEREHDIALVGEANDGAETIRLTREVHPDIVLMDIGMPVMGGIEAARTLLAEQPELKVIALSTYSDRRIVLQMLDAGARGYIVKSAGRDELLRGIRAVSHGRIYLCPDASAVLVDSVRARSLCEPFASERLGKREREVLQLLAEGHTSPTIGKKLHIATSTVEVHRRNIMRKLELHSIAELTKYAIRNGLTSS